MSNILEWEETDKGWKWEACKGKMRYEVHQVDDDRYFTPGIWGVRINGKLLNETFTLEGSKKECESFAKKIEQDNESV